MVHEELFKIPPGEKVLKVFFIKNRVCGCPPNVILVVGLIIELVGSLEFRPHRRAPALQEFINWVLIFPVHVRLGEHFEVGHKIITRSHVFQHGVDLAGVCARLLLC